MTSELEAAKLINLGLKVAKLGASLSEIEANENLRDDIREAAGVADASVGNLFDRIVHDLGCVMVLAADEQEAAGAPSE